jgi:hypothetical protein
MKFVRLFTLFSFVALLFAVGPAQAQEIDNDIEAITAFAINPNPALAGETVTFTFNFDVPDPSSANTICIYHLASAGYGAELGGTDSVVSGLGDTYTPTHADPGSGAGVCPANATRYVTAWTVGTPDDFADGGDTLSISFVVPPGASTTTFTSRQYNDGLQNTLNRELAINPPPTTVYADPAGVCAGNSPCFDDLQATVDAVATGGTVNVYGTFAGGVNINKNLTLQSSNMATINNTVAVIDGATVVIRGLNLNGTPGINVTDGNATAYANNIANGVSGTGNFSHNWWGVYDTDPGPTGSGWATRLGAAVESYGIGSLGQATVTGGSGTAVIVSHGRGSDNAPFGQATIEDGNTQCSDYYDVFVQSGSGTWIVTIPVDMGTGCDSVYQARLIAMLNMAPECTDGSQIGGCWDSALDYGTSITQVAEGSNRGLRVNGLPTSALQGTPFVSGNQDDLGPTAVTLGGLQVGHLAGNSVVVAIVMAALLLTGGALWLNRRRDVAA